MWPLQGARAGHRTSSPSEFDGRATIAKVDIDQAPGAGGTLQASSPFPTLIIFQNGYELDRIVGLTTKRVLADKLEGDADPDAAPIQG